MRYWFLSVFVVVVCVAGCVKKAVDVAGDTVADCLLPCDVTEVDAPADGTVTDAVDDPRDVTAP